MTLDALLTVLRPWPLKVVIDRVLTRHSSRVPLVHALVNNAPFTRMEILYGACAATLLIAILTGLLTYYFTRVMGDVGQRFIFELRRQLFAHLQRLSLSFHSRQHTGDLTTRLTSDVQAVQDMIAEGLIMLGSNFLLLVGMLIMMFWLSGPMTLAVLALSPLLVFTVFRYTRRIKAATRDARRSTGQMAALAQETFASIRIVQGLAQEKQQEERFETRSITSLRAYLKAVRYQARVAPLVDVLAAASLVVVMWYGARLVMTGAMTIGDVVVFFAYVTGFYAPVRALARVSYLFSLASVGADRIAEVLHVRSELAPRRGCSVAPRFYGALAFHAVSFEYEPGRAILRDINLVITPGQKIALVGATGAGKSTLAGLIPRFYDPTQGAVCLDGRDIRDFTVASLREQISLVLQDSLLFSGTIRENIAFGRPGASQAQIQAAARLANADEFIGQLPEGYDSWVSEQGGTLSGGQKQRIAIARAMLRDSPILILDEPTSNLDSEAEHAVMEALGRATLGRTTLIIAHRLSTVRLADRIVVLEQGRIIEEGTHDALLARHGKYARLYRLTQRAAAVPENAKVVAAVGPAG